jgi:hypothetical protein
MVFSNIEIQYLIGVFVDRVISGDFEQFEVKANLFLSILRGYPQRHGPQ